MLFEEGIESAVLAHHGAGVGGRGGSAFVTYAAFEKHDVSAVPAGYLGCLGEQLRIGNGFHVNQNQANLRVVHQ
ncbi:hypothetical protein D3C72_2348760 [compost metagenome]